MINEWSKLLIFALRFIIFRADRGKLGIDRCEQAEYLEKLGIDRHLQDHIRVHEVLVIDRHKGRVYLSIHLRKRRLADHARFAEEFCKERKLIEILNKVDGEEIDKTASLILALDLVEHSRRHEEDISRIDHIALTVRDIFIFILDRDTDFQDIVLVLGIVSELVVIPDTHIRIRDKVDILIFAVKHALTEATDRLAVDQGSGTIIFGV